MVTSIMCERAGLPTGVFTHKDFIGEAYSIIKTRSVTDQPLIVLEDRGSSDWGGIAKDDLKEIVRKDFEMVMKAIAPKNADEFKSVSVREWARRYQVPI